MAKIYISEETIQKMSNNLSDKDSTILKQSFSANRPEPKTPHKETQQSANLGTKKITKKHHKNVSKTKTSDLAKQRAKNKQKRILRKIALIKEEEQKLMKVRRISASLPPDRPIFSSSNLGVKYSPTNLTSTRRKTTKTNKRIKHKKSVTRINYLKEHHLLADEYASKYDDPKSQYTSIRAKNASVIKSLKKHKKTKRDWTDRFALK